MTHSLKPVLKNLTGFWEDQRFFIEIINALVEIIKQDTKKPWLRKNHSAVAIWELETVLEQLPTIG